MNLFYQPHIADGVHHLDAEESKHCTRVLRKKNGDSILITDGHGYFYEARITDANPQRCAFEITLQRAERPRHHFVHLAISPTKNPDRIEWFAEKAVELGVDAITLITCDHTEYGRVKPERLQKLMVTAMKQSLRATLPPLTGAVPVREILTLAAHGERFIAHVDEHNPLHLMAAATPAAHYLVLIGPEGDFSEAELQWAAENQFIKVSLGHNRLRTETAGLAACHMLNLVNDR